MHSGFRFARNDQAFVPSKPRARRGSADGGRERDVLTNLEAQPGFKLSKVNSSADEIFVLDVEAGKVFGKLGPAQSQRVPISGESDGRAGIDGRVSVVRGPSCV